MCVCVSRDSISACWKTPLNDFSYWQNWDFEGSTSDCWLCFFFVGCFPLTINGPIYIVVGIFYRTHTLPCANIHAPPHTHIYIYTYIYIHIRIYCNQQQYYILSYLQYVSICHISIYITHINAHSDTDIYLLWISWVVNRPPGRSGGLVQLTAGRGDSQRPPAKDGADRGPGTPKCQRLIDIACWILGYFVFFCNILFIF